MFDRIIVSCDDSHFKDFWFIVTKSWNKYFPDKKVCLAFVTDRKEDDELVLKMRKHGEVYLFPIQPNIPTPNQAKMYRHILAGNFGSDICMIEDIDTIPLQKKFVQDITSKREPNTLLNVGREVYNNTEDKGKFPISNITAESNIFKSLINPDNMHYHDLFISWCDIKHYDNKESVSNIPDPSGMIGGFSDESLMRVLIERFKSSGGKTTEIDRGVDIRKYWIDRSWWRIDVDMLKNDKYVCCNFLRPFSSNYEKMESIVKYILDDENIKKEDVIL